MSRTTKKVVAIVRDGKTIAEGSPEYEETLRELAARYDEARILAEALSELQEAVDFETVSKDGDLADMFGPGAMERLRTASRKAYDVLGEISAKAARRKTNQVETPGRTVYLCVGCDRDDCGCGQDVYAAFRTSPPPERTKEVLEEIREIFETDSIYERALLSLSDFEKGAKFFPSSVAAKIGKPSPEVYAALVWITGRGLLKEEFVFVEPGPRTLSGEAGFSEIPIPRGEAYTAMAKGSLTLPDGRTLAREEFESKLFPHFVRL